MKTSELLRKMNERTLVHGFALESSDVEKLEAELNAIVAKIVDARSFAAADGPLAELDRLQFVVAKLGHGYEIETNPRLWAFVRECDRLDDVDERRRVFEEIRLGAFLR